MTRPISQSSEQQLREELSKAVGKRPYRMWFSNTTVRCNEDGIDILAATPLAAGWIANRFSAIIEDAAKTTFGRDVPIRIAVNEQLRAEQNTKQIRLSTPVQTAPRRTGRQLLSFDNFVEGSCNRLAYAAAKQISQDDGGTISPLFIHGACGVGKTHLLQAICKFTMRTSSSKIRYVTAEQFTNEFIASSRSGEFHRFRNRYRHLDLLAIDDIHFVASKTKTQEELLHTLDAAGLRGARLVFASNEDPRQIRRLNRSLANRFVAGMIAEIQRPDRETRHTLIYRLLEKHGLELTEGGIDRLASQAVGSVREIEGAVTRLRATAALLVQDTNSTIGVEAVEMLLRSIPSTTHPIRISNVLDAVCSRSGISMQELRGTSRASNIVLWRSLASYLGRKLTTLSYPELAAALGRKNHSTVHAAVKRINRLIAQQSNETQKDKETLDLQEILDQLSWVIRARSAEDSTSKARFSNK